MLFRSLSAKRRGNICFTDKFFHRFSVLREIYNPHTYGAIIIFRLGLRADCKRRWNIPDWSIVWLLLLLCGEGLFRSLLSNHSASTATVCLFRRGEEAALAQKNSLIKLKQELGLDNTYMPKPLPSYPYSPNRKVYIKEITFDGLDEKDKRWLLKRCDLKEDSEISLRRIEEATAKLCSNLEYSAPLTICPKPPAEVITCIFF